MRFQLKQLGLVALAIILVAGFVLFGLAGMKTMLLMFLFFLLPFYLLLGFLGLNFYERILFGFFIGIAIFPLILWYVDRLLGSLLWSAVATLALLFLVWFYLDKKGKGNN